MCGGFSGGRIVVRLGDVCYVRECRGNRQGDIVVDSRLHRVIVLLQRTQTHRTSPDNFSRISIVLEGRLPPSHLHQSQALQLGST